MEGSIYSQLASFAQTWGMLIFVAIFLGALVYALRPDKSKEFRAAAQMPLNDDDEEESR